MPATCVKLILPIITALCIAVVGNALLDQVAHTFANM